MERAGKILAKIKNNDTISPEELARAAWLATVGKRIAAKASPKALVRGSLIVEVEDAVWQKNLFHLSPQILTKLSKVLGSGIIRDLEFRIGTPRRPPQPAQKLRETHNPADEAERIRDPGMRIVYRQGRKKASA